MNSALITGSTRGIGLEIAAQLAAKGFRVFIAGRSQAAVSDVVADLAKKHYEACGLRMDVSDRNSIVQAFGKVYKQTNRLDLLVNNAGILLDESKSILTIPPDVISQTMTTNAWGALFVVQTFLPLLAKGSRVINISSEAGSIGDGMSSYSPIYSISKTTLNAITCQLAHALRRQGIAVNAVCPGWVRTRMGGLTAPRSVRKGAETAVWLATEAPIQETGKFWKDRSVIPW